MRKLLIVGADARAGKTLVGCALGFALHARAMKVGVMKPVELGCAEGSGPLEPADAIGLACTAACDLPLDLIAPYRYRSRALSIPAAADEDRSPAPDLARIADSFAQIVSQSDVVLVEAPGGLAEPLNSNADVSDLATRCGLEIVLVVPNRRGCVNATLLTLAYAASRGLEVAGYIVNDAEPADGRDSAATAAMLERVAAARCLGAIRHREPMGLAIVEALFATPH
ncbi:MAG: dethiobiotin synthase [Candidatus Binataceae bacterium]